MLPRKIPSTSAPHAPPIPPSSSSSSSSPVLLALGSTSSSSSRPPTGTLPHELSSNHHGNTTSSSGLGATPQSVDSIILNNWDYDDCLKRLSQGLNPPETSNTPSVMTILREQGEKIQLLSQLVLSLNNRLHQTTNKLMELQEHYNTDSAPSLPIPRADTGNSNNGIPDQDIPSEYETPLRDIKPFERTILPASVSKGKPNTMEMGTNWERSVRAHMRVIWHGLWGINSSDGDFKINEADYDPPSEYLPEPTPDGRIVKLINGQARSFWRVPIDKKNGELYLEFKQELITSVLEFYPTLSRQALGDWIEVYRNNQHRKNQQQSDPVVAATKRSNEARNAILHRQQDDLILRLKYFSQTPFATCPVTNSLLKVASQLSTVPKRCAMFEEITFSTGDYEFIPYALRQYGQEIDPTNLFARQEQAWLSDEVRTILWWLDEWIDTYCKTSNTQVGAISRKQIIQLPTKYMCTTPPSSDILRKMPLQELENWSFNTWINSKSNDSRFKVIKEKIADRKRPVTPLAAASAYPKPYIKKYWFKYSEEERRKGELQVSDGKVDQKETMTQAESSQYPQAPPTPVSNKRSATPIESEKGSKMRKS